MPQDPTVHAESLTQAEAMAVSHPEDRQPINLAEGGQRYGEYYAAAHHAAQPDGQIVHPATTQGDGPVA
ncbi:hypothetical protein [Amycolatopsis kentuckyensis]|uniref:hypothetical protein n=1 Tax=Amycolatopsis kentuckyensis TaxID=218823 RepID=UPI003565C1DC